MSGLTYFPLFDCQLDSHVVSRMNNCCCPVVRHLIYPILVVSFMAFQKIIYQLITIYFSFNREEWSRVYQHVYSENIQEKWSGLNTMTMWKSRFEKNNISNWNAWTLNKNFDYRVAKLPLGVECSLYLLQGILRDEEFKINPKGSVSENDVVLMYSTAIIRWVIF